MFSYPNYGGYQQYPQGRGNAFQSPQMPAQSPQQSGMVWVSCEQEAAGYLVAPNSAVAMWDMNAPAVYLKQADAAGRPSFKAYDLVERTERPAAAPAAQAGDYITREEFDRLAAAVAALTKEEASNE